MMVLYLWGSVPSSLFRGFTSLWMTQDSTPYLLIRAQAVFLRDWHAITCPMGEDCPSFFYSGGQDAILIPMCHPRLLRRSSPILVALKLSRPLREAQDVFLGEQLVTICPVAEYRYVFLGGDTSWRPIWYMSWDAALVALGHTK